MSVGRFTKWRSLIDGQEVSAIPDRVVDNFEDVDSDPSGPYEDGQDITDYYNGDVDNFERTTSNVLEGGHALAVITDGTTNQIYSMPGDGLPRYPKAGETVICLIREPSGNPGQEVPLYITDANGGIDGYGIRTTASGGRIGVNKWEDGDYTVLSATDVSLSEETWYWYEFETPTTADNSMTTTAYEVSVENGSPERGSELATETASDSDFIKDEGTEVGVGIEIVDSSNNEATLDWINIAE